MHKGLPVLIAVLPLISCSNSSRENSSTTSLETAQPAEAAADTVEEPIRNIPFKVKEFEKKVGENELEIEYPVAGNPALLEAVRTWINQQLGETYRGSLEDAHALFRHYAAGLGKDPELNEYGGFTQDKFDLEFSDDIVVTYGHTSYTYEGGAHGMGGDYGTTFLQADGSVFDKGCITSYKPLMPLFIKGLKRYFKVSTDSELLDCLIGVPSLQKLSAPGMEPWIEEEGVTFSYTPYEIAPYSAGSPRFTIPFAEIRPYLTEKGLRFLPSPDL